MYELQHSNILASTVIAAISAAQLSPSCVLVHVMPLCLASLSCLQVEMLCIWGVNNGHVWDYAAAGPHGLTAMHLAALLGDGGKVADQLTGQLTRPCIHHVHVVQLRSVTCGASAWYV